MAIAAGRRAGNLLDMGRPLVVETVTIPGRRPRVAPWGNLVARGARDVTAGAIPDQMVTGGPYQTDAAMIA